MKVQEIFQGIDGIIFGKMLPNIQRVFWFSLQRLFGIFVNFKK